MHVRVSESAKNQNATLVITSFISPFKSSIKSSVINRKQLPVLTVQELRWPLFMAEVDVMKVKG